MTQTERWSLIKKVSAFALAIASAGTGVVFAAGSLWNEVHQHTTDIADLKQGQEEMNRKLDRLIERLIPRDVP